jgi:lysozyme family protein
MAEIIPAFERMILKEGGYVLHKVEGGRGGQTCSGIARNIHSDWPGWVLIDNGEDDSAQLTALVLDFYRSQFWDKIKGDQMLSQAVADFSLDYAVNTDVSTAIKLLQMAVGVTVDGVMDEKTLLPLNRVSKDRFASSVMLAKITRYANISKRDPSQRKFVEGWINSTSNAV